MQFIVAELTIAGHNVIAYNHKLLRVESWCVLDKKTNSRKRFFEKVGEIVKTADFIAAGLNNCDVAKLCSDGIIVRIGNGFYRLYMKNWKTKFLESSVLGQTIDKEKSDAVILRCIELAYRDMMTAGRYYSSHFLYNKKNLCSNLKQVISNDNYCFSRDLIDSVSKLIFNTDKAGEGNKYVSSYGLAQKLVNMSFKYFYVFEDYIDHQITFSNCDCPLDSIILANLPNTKYVWSKLTTKQYEKIQNKISVILKTKSIDDELCQLGNLAFDFITW